MKLDCDQFPAINNLADDVREKALEYAATLGARGPRPTTVLGTAVTLANEWKSGRLPARPLAAPYLVQPRLGRWAIKRATDAEPSHTFCKKDDAVRRAQDLAKAAGAACFVFGPGGTLIERYQAKTLAQASPTPRLRSEAIVALAPEPVPEPIVALAPEPVPEPIVALAPAIASGDDDELPTENPSGEDPIRVKKLAGKWALILGDGRTETLPTQKKAVARAKLLAKKLGRTVVLA